MTMSFYISMRQNEDDGSASPAPNDSDGSHEEFGDDYLEDEDFLDSPVDDGTFSDDSDLFTWNVNVSEFVENMR